MKQIADTAKVSKQACIHDDAVIDHYSVIGPHVRIGKGTYIGPFCHITGDGLFIGDKCKVAMHSRLEGKVHISDETEISDHVTVNGRVFVANNSKLESSCKIKNQTTIGRYCVIGEYSIIGATPSDFLVPEDTSVIIGDRTEIKQQVTVERGFKEKTSTRIGNGCVVLRGCHIGANCNLEDEVLLTNDTKLAGYVHIGKHSNLGANTTVEQFGVIGPYAFAAAFSRIKKGVLPYAVLAKIRGHQAIAGCNIVGMQKAKLSEEEINNVREAYKILDSKATVEQKLEKLERLETKEADLISEFLEKTLSKDLRERFSYYAVVGVEFDPRKVKARKFHTNDTKK